MKAITYDRYGPPNVLEMKEVEKPVPASDEILIKVRAAAVTTADWRLRASAFPGGMWPIGRLMFGIFKPRNRILGTDIAGDVVAVGANVSNFKIGHAVFGHIGKRGHAEFALAKESGAIVSKPDHLGYPEAAALPFGALCSLVFLRDFSKLKSGQRILIIGASGNVGVYAIQIAKAFGGHVTAVASGPNADLVQSLGADQFIDYKNTDVERFDQKFDLIFDTFGLLSFSQARRLLADTGTFLPLNFGLGSALLNLLTGWLRRQKMITAVNDDNQEDLLALVDLLNDDKLKPVIDTVYPFEEFLGAHRHVEGRRRKGSVVLDFTDL